MGQYWDWSKEYNPCLYCADRRCDCSTHEDDVREKCTTCCKRKCKFPDCDKYATAIVRYEAEK